MLTRRNFVKTLIAKVLIFGGAAACYFGAYYAITAQIDAWRTEEACINEHVAKGVNPNNIKRIQGGCEVHTYQLTQESE